MRKIPRTIPMFFLAFGLVALGAHAFAAVLASPFPPISAAQALANQGQTVTVEGVASIHQDSRLGSYFDLDGKWPATHFSAYIPDGNEHVFPPFPALWAMWWTSLAPSGCAGASPPSSSPTLRSCESSGSRH
jgi:hypothetical protein